MDRAIELWREYQASWEARQVLEGDDREEARELWEAARAAWSKAWLAALAAERDAYTAAFSPVGAWE